MTRYFFSDTKGLKNFSKTKIVNISVLPQQRHYVTYSIFNENGKLSVYLVIWLGKSRQSNQKFGQSSTKRFVNAMQGIQKQKQQKVE